MPAIQSIKIKYNLLNLLGRIKFINEKKKKKVYLYLRLFFILLLLAFLFFQSMIDTAYEKYKYTKLIESKPIENQILDWDIINKEFLNLARKYQYLIKNEKNIPDDCPIWIMWFQGINNAPQIIKSCIQSILINRAKHPVIFLDKSNIKKYLELPEYILSKFEDRLFTITHFSDIVRMALLSKFGGYWIDSTYLITAPLNYSNLSLFTLKLSRCGFRLTKCLWAGNFLAMPKNSFLSTYIYNALLFYWKKYTKLINYFLIDYIIKIAYENIKELRDMIEKIPYIDCDIFQLQNDNFLNSIYNEKSPIKCTFNKLKKSIEYIDLNNETMTNLKYIIDNYKLYLNNISNLKDIIK